MFDLVLTLIIIYLAYRIFYQKNTFLNRAAGKPPLRKQQDHTPNSSTTDSDDGEYIDYEEVDE